MSRAMEELFKEGEFKARVDAVFAIMERFGVTKEQALEILKVPKNEYPKYLSYLGAC